LRDDESFFPTGKITATKERAGVERSHSVADLNFGKKEDEIPAASKGRT
jgi:hypothetical protein